MKVWKDPLLNKYSRSWALCRQVGLPATLRVESQAGQVLPKKSGRVPSPSEIGLFLNKSRVFCFDSGARICKGKASCREAPLLLKKESLKLLGENKRRRLSLSVAQTEV